MTIPKSYEALAADLASEKILSKTLLGQKESYMMIANQLKLDLATWKQKACEAAEREAELREELEESDAVVTKLSTLLAGVAIALRGPELELHRHGYNGLPELISALQHRLTVAEQRLSQVEGACDLAMSAIDDDERGANFVKIIQAIKDKAALKPAAEVAAYCTHPPGCKQCSWCGFKAESKLAAEGEGS